jgi:hypothetical protein
MYTRPSSVCSPPPAVRIWATNTITLIAMSTWVARGSAALIARGACTRVFCFAHSGHRIPTGVGVMQSGQIGLPHDEQETPVSTEGWR